MRKFSILTAVSFMLIAIMAIPANGATGGLSSIYFRAHHHACKRHSPKQKCQRQGVEPAKPLESPAPFAAEAMEVFQVVDPLTKAPTPPKPFIVGFAKAYFPLKDKIVIRFLAEYGSFESQISGSGQYPDYYSRYILPPEGKMSPDGYDEAWMVVMDVTKHTFVETEHVRFNILEPENVRHPAG